MAVQQQRIDDEDLFWLLVVAVFIVGSGGLVVAREHVVDWLVKHSVLVPAAASPWISIPGTGGAGIDGSRVLIAVSALAAVGICAVAAHRRRAPVAGGGAR